MELPQSVSQKFAFAGFVQVFESIVSCKTRFQSSPVTILNSICIPKKKKNMYGYRIAFLEQLWLWRNSVVFIKYCHPCHETLEVPEAINTCLEMRHGNKS